MFSLVTCDLVSDFLKSYVTITDLSEETTVQDTSPGDIAPSTSIAEQLPEGFFDDPIMDAKVSMKMIFIIILKNVDVLFEWFL